MWFRRNRQIVETDYRNLEQEKEAKGKERKMKIKGRGLWLALENRKPKVRVGFRTYNMGYNLRYTMN